MSTITTTSTNQLPAWYTQYAQNLLGRGLSVTSEPYQEYGAARVAGFTPDQQQAMQLARQSVGIGEPIVQQAQQATQQATAATFPQAAETYMNPYIQGVVNNIGTMAARNLQENLLPQVNRTFVGGGTFGGSRSADFTNRAVRDANESAMRQQAQTLAEGYGQAADIFNLDVNRQLTGAGQLGNLGQKMQQMRGTDVASLGGIGQQQQNLGQTSANLAYEDFVRQRDFPYTQVQRLSGLGQGINLPETKTTQAPGPNSTAATLGGIGSVLAGVGSIFAPNLGRP
jgi:hypothetical protein